MYKSIVICIYYIQFKYKLIVLNKSKTKKWITKYNITMVSEVNV